MFQREVVFRLSRTSLPHIWHFCRNAQTLYLNHNQHQSRSTSSIRILSKNSKNNLKKILQWNHLPLRKNLQREVLHRNQKARRVKNKFKARADTGQHIWSIISMIWLLIFDWSQVNWLQAIQPHSYQSLHGGLNYEISLSNVPHHWCRQLSWYWSVQLVRSLVCLLVCRLTLGVILETDYSTGAGAKWYRSRLQIVRWKQ